MRTSVPQYFPSRSEGGRDYAPSPMVPLHTADNHSHSHPNNNHHYPAPIPFASASSSSSSLSNSNSNSNSNKPRKLGTQSWRKQKQNSTPAASPSPSPSQWGTSMNTDIGIAHTSMNTQDGPDLDEDIRRHNKGTSKSTKRTLTKSRIISPVSVSASNAIATTARSHANTTTNANTNISMDAPRVMVDPDGFQIYVNQKDEEIFSTCTSKASTFDFYSNTGIDTPPKANGTATATASTTTAATDTWPVMDMDIQKAPLVTPTEQNHDQNHFFPKPYANGNGNGNGNANLAQKKQKQEQQQQVDIDISPPKHVSDFDTYHNQDGLDDSTVGTALSRRHLLRNRANAFLQYASSVEQEHQQKQKKQQQHQQHHQQQHQQQQQQQQQQHQHQQRGKQHKGKSFTSSSSPVSMLIKGKKKVKSMGKGIGITRTSTSTRPWQKKGFKMNDDDDDEMEEEQQHEQQRDEEKEQGKEQEQKNVRNPRTLTRIRRSEKIEQLMIKTMGKDKSVQSQSTSQSHSMPMVENIGKGLSPIQHDKRMSSIDTVENDEGARTGMNTRPRAHHVHARNLNSGESSRGFAFEHGNATTNVNGNTRKVGLYKLSHESMLLDEAGACHAETVDRCFSMDSSKSGLGISTLSRRLSRFGDESEVEIQDPSQSQSQSQSQAQGTLESTAPSPVSMRKDILLTPATEKKKGARARMDRYNSHDEMSPLVEKRQVSDQSAVSALSSRRLNRLPPTGSRKFNTPKQKLEVHVSETDLGDIPMRSETSLKKEIQTSESSSTRIDPIDKLSQQRQGLNESVEKANPGNSVAEKTHPTSPPAKESHRTPTKAEARFHSDPFLDSSWQPSPIQPGGSFAIFDDSHVEDSDRNSSPVKSMVQQGCDISSSPQDMYQPQEQSEFLRVVASIVIQTFFRRHLAYNATCQRYIAVLKIQRFLHTAMERRQTQRMALDQTTHQFYDLASTQIQATWRGFWVRDCINVESYCACTIQKSFRSYWARLSYKFDIYRIMIAQSAARRYLVSLRMKKQAAATLIQSKWRGYAANEAFVNIVTDVIIAQSVCRKFLVKKNMDIIRSKRSKLQRSQPRTDRNIMKNAPMSHSERTIKAGTATAARKVASNVLRQRRNGDLNQLNADDLIRKWKARRSSSAHVMAEI